MHRPISGLKGGNQRASTRRRYSGSRLVRALSIASLNGDCTLAASSAISEGKRDRVGRNVRRAEGARACVGGWSGGEAEVMGWRISSVVAPVSLSSSSLFPRILAGTLLTVSSSFESISKLESM